MCMYMSSACKRGRDRGRADQNDIALFEEWLVGLSGYESIFSLESCRFAGIQYLGRSSSEQDRLER